MRMVRTSPTSNDTQTSDVSMQAHRMSTTRSVRLSGA